MIKMILSVIAFAVGGGIFFLYTQPRFDSIRATATEVGQYDEALQKAAELQALKQSLLSRYNAFNPADVERLQKLLPDHVDNVRLVLDLDNLAARHGLALQNVVISDSAGGKENTGAVAAVGENLQKYDSLTLKFATQGTYPNFKAFLEDMETSLRVVDLVELRLARESSQTELLYRYDITIKTYWLK